MVELNNLKFPHRVNTALWVLRTKNKNKWKWTQSILGPREMAQCWRGFAAFVEDQSPFSRTQESSNIVCNSCSRGSSTFFSPLGTTDTHNVHKHEGRQNLYTHKNTYSKSRICVRTWFLSTPLERVWTLLPSLCFCWWVRHRASVSP